MAQTASRKNVPREHRRLIAAFADELELRDPDGTILADDPDRSESILRSSVDRLFASSTWEATIGPVYDVDGVARLIGGGAPVTRQAVSKRRLLALKTGSGRVVYPAFQFNEDGSVVDGVADVLKLIEPTQLSSWTIAAWFVSPEDGIEGMQPIEALRSGGRDAVLQVARRWASALQ
jgi:hypothetical protein